MNKPQKREHQTAWYCDSRDAFLAASVDEIANQLARRAIDDSLDIEPQQTEEWRASVHQLQHSLHDNVPIIRAALSRPGTEAIRSVILEYDFRRRGLRIDCVLLADGAIFVVEFKRNSLGASDRDQVMNYAINLVEFHHETRTLCERDGTIVLPVLALTNGKARKRIPLELGGHSWPMISRRPIECDSDTLGESLTEGLALCGSRTSISLNEWLDSSFRPSSSIVDATLSLFGNHDVSSIAEHAAPAEEIDASTTEIRDHINDALEAGHYHIIFLSGAPGAGKTLVGLDLVMRGKYAADSVFVTGNAPLVEVLNKALSKSYRGQGSRESSWAVTGYKRSDAALVAEAATYKIVKAHNFLGKRGKAHKQEDGRVLVFDEAQRTYEKGRPVLGVKLPDHEADLVLQAQRTAYPSGGAVVVALIGHNQAINRGERGIIAWIDAAEANNWTFSISDETLDLAELKDRADIKGHPHRRVLMHGHLHQSMRYYRNAEQEKWADAVLAGNAKQAREIADRIMKEGDVIELVRDLEAARKWARPKSVGGARSGIIASAQARRLAAVGLFVDHKPDIATWMLAPNGDVRSSMALETVQNQFQVQGLELEYCVVCWDADLRRENSKWASYKLSGSDWQKDKLIDVAKNGYRVLLTRARKGMILFVPKGDPSRDDETRSPEFYDDIASFLIDCGAIPSA